MARTPRIDVVEEEVFTDLENDPDAGEAGDELDSFEQELLADKKAAAAKAKAAAEEEGEADEEFDDLPAREGDEPAAEGDEEEEGEDEAEDEEEGEAEPDPKDREIAQLKLTNLVERANRLEAQKQAATDLKARSEASIVADKAAWKLAKEKGEDEAELAALERMTNARSNIQAAEGQLVQIAQAENHIRAEYRKLVPEDGATPETPAREATPANKNKGAKWAPKFFEANPWAAKPKNAKEAAAQRLLYSIDADIKASDPKLDPNSDAYRKELVTRFNKAKPGLIKDIGGSRVATGERRRGNGRPADGVSAGGTQRRTTPANEPLKFTTEDAQNMRTFGQDPNNKKARLNYLAEKRAYERKETARG